MNNKQFDKDLLKKFLLIGIVPTVLVSSFLLGRIYFVFEDINKKSHEKVLKDIQFYVDSLRQEIEEETAFLQNNFQKINLQRFIEANDEIETLMVFDRKTHKMIHLVSDFPLTKNEQQNYLQHNKFNQYKDITKASFHLLHNSINGKNKTISYVIPTQKYIFIFDINFDLLEDFVKYVKQSIDYIILVVDKNGNYLINTSNEPYFHNNFFTTEYYTKVVQKYSPLEYVEFFNDEQDIDNFMVYYQSDSTGWTFVTIEDYDSLDDQVLALLPFIIILLPLIIFGILSSAKQFTHKIVTPLEILIAKMEEFATVNNPQKIDTKTIEYSLFKRIIESFNTMQDKILKREQELEESNKLLLQKTKEVSSLNETLQQRVEQEIEKNRKKDQQMIQQSRLAQMGEMISMIAHQWRQPLAAIGAVSASLEMKVRLKKADDETVITHIKKISSYTQHLSKTIDDFRDFFKTTKEKKSITYSEIIESVLNIVESSLENKNIKIIQNLGSTTVFKTYPNELKQVLLNLIKNAEDALLENNSANPTITITTQENRLMVEDNGGGIAEDILSKIFDPYFSTKNEKNGAGLGLYMSKMIVEEHCGGKLEVQNTKDGALFTIVL